MATLKKHMHSEGTQSRCMWKFITHAHVHVLNKHNISDSSSFDPSNTMYEKVLVDVVKAVISKYPSKFRRCFKQKYIHQHSISDEGNTTLVTQSGTLLPMLLPPSSSHTPTPTYLKVYTCMYTHLPCSLPYTLIHLCICTYTHAYVQMPLNFDDILATRGMNDSDEDIDHSYNDHSYYVDSILDNLKETATASEFDKCCQTDGYISRSIGGMMWLSVDPTQSPRPDDDDSKGGVISYDARTYPYRDNSSSPVDSVQSYKRPYKINSLLSPHHTTIPYHHSIQSHSPIALSSHSPNNQKQSSARFGNRDKHIVKRGRAIHDSFKSGSMALSGTSMTASHVPVFNDSIQSLGHASETIDSLMHTDRYVDGTTRHADDDDDAVSAVSQLTEGSPRCCKL